MIIHDIFEDERQLIEGQELSGYVDVQTLVHLLPSVSSPRDFEMRSISCGLAKNLQ
jgi:hypothetical protein